MPLNKCEAEKAYSEINPFLKALAETIVQFSTNSDTAPAHFSPRRFLHELANKHRRAILFSEHSAETLEYHKVVVVLFHDTLADLVDAVE